MALLFTQYGCKTFFGCAGCARKAQALGFVGTSLLGWWGIPFGLILTPVGLVANVYHVFRSGFRREPSAMLRRYARERLALGTESSDGLPE